jgi:uncharacterized RDD family membrane protein YckC
MSSSGRLLAMAACLLAAGGQLAAQPAPGGQTLLLAGSEQALWLIRADGSKNSFDLCVRKAGGAWRWIDQDLAGRPAVAAVSDELLHLFFRDTGDYLTFGPQRGERTVQYRPQDANWPSRQAPLSLCAGPDRQMFALVARPVATATRPATTAPGVAGPEAATVTFAPATAPAAPGAGSSRRILGLFHQPGQRWQHLLDVPQEDFARGDVAAVAYAGDKLYVLLHAPAATPDTATLLSAQWPIDPNKPAWSPVPLAGLPAKGRIIGMVGGRRPVIVISLPAGPAPRELATCMPMAEGKGWVVRTVGVGDKPQTWPAAQAPLSAAIGEQIALLWKDEKGFGFATCDPLTGTLAIGDAKGLFARQPIDEFGTAMQEYFVWIVVIIVLLPLLIFRPRAAAVPFALPDTVRPAHLGKRLLAAAVDFLPFHLAGMAIVRVVVPDLSVDDLWRQMKDVFSGQSNQSLPAAFVIEAIASLTAYVIYCIVMESLTGATVGKRLLALRVVGPGGQGADFRLCLLRNVFKMLEFMMPIPWAFVPIFTRYRQRLGDLLAHTAVVEDNFPAVEAKPDVGSAAPEQRDESDKGERRQ